MLALAKLVHAPQFACFVTGCRSLLQHIMMCAIALPLRKWSRYENGPRSENGPRYENGTLTPHLRETFEDSLSAVSSPIFAKILLVHTQRITLSETSREGLKKLIFKSLCFFEFLNLSS